MPLGKHPTHMYRTCLAGGIKLIHWFFMYRRIGDSYTTPTLDGI